MVERTKTNNNNLEKKLHEKTQLLSKLRSSNYVQQYRLAYNLSYYNVYTQNAETLQAVFHWVT